MPTDSIRKETLLFQNNRKAVAVFPAKDDKPRDIVSALALEPYQAVILVLGGADNLDPALHPRLIQLFNRGIARAAAEAGAIVLDGGTQAGVMSLMGQSVAERGYRTALIGVAPVNLVTYPGSKMENNISLESNHSHFVLVEGNTWESKSQLMFSLVKELTDRSQTVQETDSSNGTARGPANKVSGKPATGKTFPLPKLALVAGGKATTKKEVLYAVRQSIPLIIFEGSGGMADEIVLASKDKETLINDPDMAEIIEDGEIHFHSLNQSAKGIERLVIRELGTDKVLTQAWETFAEYDYNANLQQKKFYIIQMAILFVGVIGTALVILQQVFAPRHRETGELYTASELFSNKELIGWWMLRHLLILTPILLTVLVTAATRFKQGTKWLLLRAGAEAIKREIYRYRARAMYYREHPEQQLDKLEKNFSAGGQQPAKAAPALSPEQQLSKRVEDITLRTMRTEVNLSSLVPYKGSKGFPPYCKESGDDGFSIMTPDRYVEIRLGSQLEFYKRGAVKLDKQLNALYWTSFIIGGAGTYLAAIDMQIWIALTTSIIGAFGTYLGYRQIENTLTKYNQAATDLTNVKTWWNALSAEEQSWQINIDSLVEHTEQVLQSELDGWIQQMQNALAELRKGQEVPAEREEKKEPLEPEPSSDSGSKPSESQPKEDGAGGSGIVTKEIPSAATTGDLQTLAQSDKEINGEEIDTPQTADNSGSTGNEEQKDTSKNSG